MRLGDGSTVWFFGDTGERRADGALRFFEIGSAAWSPPDEPTVTIDHVIEGDRVVPFADPTADFPRCPSEASTAGMWPLAAVLHPNDENTVLVWMANVCLGSGRAVVPRGVSVGRWRYDPSAPPGALPIKVEVLNQNLFPGGRLGEAAFTGDDGNIYLYGCEIPADELADGASGTCYAARVDPARVADPAAHEVWNGSAWRRGDRPAQLQMDEPDSGPSTPPGPMSVAEYDGHYVMLYTPWPGFIPLVEIRAAASPQGPWSAPVQLEPPGCDDEMGGRARTCYAANLQPHLNRPGRLAFGYYDQLVDGPPPLGSYVLSSVEVSVTRSRRADQPLSNS